MALRLASLPLRGAAVAARFAVPASARSVALQSPARIPAVLGVARRHMSAPAGGLPPWLTITNIRKYAPQIGMAAGAIVVVSSRRRGRVACARFFSVPAIPCRACPPRAGASARTSPCEHLELLRTTVSARP